MLTIIYYWIKQNWFTFACYYTRIRKHLIYKYKKKILYMYVSKLRCLFSRVCEKGICSHCNYKNCVKKEKKISIKSKKKKLENVYQNCLVMYIYQYINCIFTCTFLVNKHVHDSVSSHNSMASLLVMHTEFWNTILIKIDPIRW